MLTKLTVRNFKRFVDADIQLDKSVVLIGPNNSGKTTALQALALWELGLRRWTEKRQGKSIAKQRQGVAINRRDLVALPIPTANLLWRHLKVRNVDRLEDKKPKTQNIRIDILVEGISEGKAWSCGLEFDYANEESFYCRPLRLEEGDKPERMEIPELATRVRVALLPPMSGLADREFIKQPGEIGVLVGQGQTAQVLRNLCYRVCFPSEEAIKPSDDWKELTGQIDRLFGVKLQLPKFIAERSEIVMFYEEKSGTRLDLSSSGRGFQQTLLILAHLYANPRTVLLLDEPDAHLEVLRQRQTYQLITDLAEQKGSQIIAASHSEVVLAEAANRGMVVAFVGKPHTLNDNRNSQVMKALTDLGWDQYYEAEQTGWVLYVEDSTDLAILKAFAKILGHPAELKLDRPFVHYVATNLPQRSRDHFNGLREAKNDLVGLAIFDRLERELQSSPHLNEIMWKKREIENYFCKKEILMQWAVHDIPDDVFGLSERLLHQQAMEKAIEDVGHLLEIDEKSPWSSDVKASDEVLDRIFRLFFKELGLPLTFRKRDYHLLTGFLSKDDIETEVIEKLNAIVETANRAKPCSE